MRKGMPLAPARPLRALCWSVMALGLLWLTACTSGNEEGSCASDSECGRGQICQNGACNAVPCFGAAECPGANQTCLESGQCSAIECISNDDCVVDGLGSSCIAGACFSTCSGNDDCPSGQICNRQTQQCVPAPTDCSDDSQCPTGKVCDTDLARCVDPAPNNGENNGENNANNANNGANNGDNNGDNNGGPTNQPACSPCGGDGECGDDDDRCTLLGDGMSYCTTGCATNADCPTGFECTRNLQNDPLQCIPAGNACGGCLAPGSACNNGQVCDPDARVCITPRSNCQACTNDAQCGDGGKCYENMGDRVCGVSCDSDVDCGAGYACANREGVNVCVALEGCDGGNNNDMCPETPQCGDELPIFNEEFCTCVQCNEDTDCGDGKVCGSNFRCLVSSQACANVDDCQDPAAPYCLGGYCVECLSSVDCANNANGDSCFDGACGTCSCPVGQTCNSRGDCIENPGCTSDADCGMGAQGPGRCDDNGQCYEAGICDSAVFADQCPEGLTCQDFVIVKVCAGCTDTSQCRAGETCCPSLFDPAVLLCSGLPCQ
jgi:hypothetical protein